MGSRGSRAALPASPRRFVGSLTELISWRNPLCLGEREKVMYLRQREEASRCFDDYSNVYLVALGVGSSVAVFRPFEV